MTLPRFLDCAFTLLFDEYQRAGQDLLTAMEKLQQWQPGPERATSVENVAARNQAAMSQLQAILAGVGR